MEPLAPGTEDDVLDFNAETRKHPENERILNQKGYLWNGQYGNIYKLSYSNDVEYWFCQVCKRPVVGGLYEHEVGREHARNRQMTNNRARALTEEQFSVEVAPGEPAPPGMEEASRPAQIQKPMIAKKMPIVSPIKRQSVNFMNQPDKIEEQKGIVQAVSVEPLPPGVEPVSKHVEREARIQEKLDTFKSVPLVALEYLIEMIDYDPNAEPLYLCILCDKRGDPRTVFKHLSSFNHISQYLSRHFPQCYRALAPFMAKPYKAYKKNWQETLQKIAEAIEKKFGRLRPICVEKDKFEKDRMPYITLIIKGKHFSEQMGPTFVELVDFKELTRTADSSPDKNIDQWGGKSFIEKPFKKLNPSPPLKKSTEDEAKPSIPAASKKIIPSKGNLNKRPAHVQPSRRQSMSSISSVSSDEELDIKRARTSSSRRFRRPSPSPSKLQNRKTQKEIEEERQNNIKKERLEKLSEYKKLCIAIESDLGRTLKNYEQNPEKHPKYNDEWKAFWNKRYKELQTEGKDVSKYDFKPEWIIFWGKRMLQLHHEELKNRKEALGKRLGIPQEPPPVSFSIKAPVSVSKFNVKAAPVVQEEKPTIPLNLPPVLPKPEKEVEVILIDDKDDNDSSGSHSPWESDPPPKVSTKSRKKESPQSNRWQKERIIRAKDKDKMLKIKRKSSEKEFYEKRGSSSRDFHKDRSIRSRSPESYRSDRFSKSSENRKPERERSPESYRSDRFGKSSENRKLERERSPESYRSDRFSKNSENRKPERERYRESSFERDLKGKERIRTVADLPWEKEKLAYSQSIPSRKSMPLRPVEDDDDDEEVNIVSVLRLLTAIEERLGSLGPKINDLLAQALALEKNEANSSESLLDNDLNCVMFETVKEKLKGQLIAGLVEPIQERAFKKAIKKTARLIHSSSERSKKKAGSSSTGPINATRESAGVDKAAIAIQLANALIAQGKTDVTQEQLEQLISTVVGMAEASKASNKPITTADFLAHLSSGSVIPLELPKEKIIIPRERPNLDKRSNSNDGDFLKNTESLSPSTPEKYYNNMENLSDSDLQTLLQNFKDLSADEQINLIGYLKKLELHEPQRVERLRKFVNLGSDKASKDVGSIEKDESKSRKNGRESPFSSRLDAINPDADEMNKSDAKIIHIDSEEEDYSYDDVVKAASKNIKQQEMEDTRRIIESSMGLSSSHTNLTDAKALISNLMGSFSTSTSSSGLNLMGLTATTTTKASTNFPISTPSTDLVRNLGDINMANLAKIVSSVQKSSTSENSGQTKSSKSHNEFDIPREKRLNIPDNDHTHPMPLPPPHVNQPAPVPSPHFQSQRPIQNFSGGNQMRYQGPRGPPYQQAARPVDGNVRYPVSNPNFTPGPRPGGFNQRPPPNNNFAGGNYNQNMRGSRPGRPLLNLTFGNARMAGNRPRFTGPTHNDRW